MATAKAILNNISYVQVAPAGDLIIQSLGDSVYIVFSDVQPSLGNKVAHVLNNTFMVMRNTGLPMWAHTHSTNASLIITVL